MHPTSSSISSIILFNVELKQNQIYNDTFYRSRQEDSDEEEASSSKKKSKSESSQLKKLLKGIMKKVIDFTDE